MLAASDLVYTLPPELSAEYAHGRLVLRVPMTEATGAL